MVSGLKSLKNGQIPLDIDIFIILCYHIMFGSYNHSICNSMKILLVEDEEAISIFIKKGLEAEFFIVDVANDGTDGEKMARINEYDAIILDHNLPGKNGIQICKSLRESGDKRPVIMLTAENEVEKKVEAFDCGASGYMTKPFAIEELVARIRALLRFENKGDDTVLSQKDIELDLKKYTAKRADKFMSLRKKEFALLEYFLRNPEKVLTRSMILEHVWDTNADPFTNTVDVHIRSLRQKLNEGFPEKLIDTVRGIGYRL